MTMMIDVVDKDSTMCYLLLIELVLFISYIITLILYEEKTSKKKLS